MLSSNQNTHLSKLLSYILRHKPGEYEIVLDENGYTNVDELIYKLNAHNENISFEILLLNRYSATPFMLWNNRYIFLFCQQSINRFNTCTLN